MRRWNGWGNSDVTSLLTSAALGFLRQVIGEPAAPHDATLRQVLARVAKTPSRLPRHPLVDASAAARLAASFGQSAWDWLRLRFGEVDAVTDGVAFPEHEGQVRELLDWAASVRACVLPCGGATSVVGHLMPPNDPRPLLTLNLTRMMRLKWLDPVAQLAGFEAGVAGPQLESQLRAQGFTLGHYPQSFECSTLGGWVVTRSSGQQSARYGRIEQLFAGGTLITPSASLRVGGYPASAAGPDLREWVMGSEGRLGVLTEAIVRVTRLPEVEQFVGLFFPDWERAIAAVRELAQARLGLSMLRLANATETMTTLTLAGHARAIAWLERYLLLRGAGGPGENRKCLLFAGFTGGRIQVAAMRRLAFAIAARYGVVSTGALLGRKWAASRFRGAYLRNSLWDAGYAVDTMETACDWSQTPSMVEAIESAGRKAMADCGERVHACTHLSHVYASGSSVYSTFVYRIGPDYPTALARWRALKQSVGDAIVAMGGTISHQHGVGKDHAPWLVHEKGAAGLRAIAAVVHHFDPDGLMARGNLLGDA
jgi:alkyldihydroxyacetonephosphate synthase